MKEGALFITFLIPLLIILFVILIDKEEPQVKHEPWILEMPGMINPTLHYQNYMLCADIHLPSPGIHKPDASFCIDHNGSEFENGTWFPQSDSVKYNKYITPVKDSVRVIAQRIGLIREVR